MPGEEFIKEENTHKKTVPNSRRVTSSLPAEKGNFVFVL
jgi:hypothetical protein